MVNLTKNLGLKKPTKDEFYDVEVQNENMEILDKLITYGTEELIEGESELPTGTIHLVYEE